MNRYGIASTGFRLFAVLLTMGCLGCDGDKRSSTSGVANPDGSPSEDCLRVTEAIDGGEVRPFGPAGPKYSLQDGTIKIVTDRPDAARFLLALRLRSPNGIVRANAYDYVNALRRVPATRTWADETLRQGLKDDSSCVRTFVEQLLSPSAASQPGEGDKVPSTLPSPEAEKGLAVREMLIRLAISRRPWVEVWFIDYGNGDSAHMQDPPASFLKRFSDLQVTIKGVSSMNDDKVFVRDRETAKDGWRVYARVVRWLDDTTAEVKFGDRQAPESSSRSEGVVREEQGQWVLIEEMTSHS